MSKPTSHDLMRTAMVRHGITADDLIGTIVRELGADRQRVADMVKRFTDGGPGTIAVHAAIIGLAAEHESAQIH